MAQALALKYRPRTFDDLCEQEEIKIILSNQIETNTIKHGYLFTGPAGCGKTTSARIFASMINDGEGSPIELDAASNNSVEDIRTLIKQSETKPLDSKYKVFILDEVHSLSSQAWQAFLKTLEEPPTTAVFILCTTNPEKIPQTILSRVQRYNFQRISQQGIVTRLKWICDVETKNIMEEMGDQDSATDIEWAREQHLPIIEYSMDALEYIAKIADGGMRDAITLMDKCLSYNTELTLENVIKALGVADYETMDNLLGSIVSGDVKNILEVINTEYNSGIDLKQFVKDFFEFVLEAVEYIIFQSNEMIRVPEIYLTKVGEYNFEMLESLLDLLVDMQSSIKWEQNPKYYIISKFILFATGGSDEK